LKADEAAQLPLPQGSTGLPLLGETLTYSQQGPLRFGLERYLKYGAPIFKTSLWGAEFYMVCSMDAYKALMAEDTKLVNFNVGGTFGKLQGDFALRFLANVDGMRMPMRRTLLTALTTEALTGYAAKIAAIAADNVAYLAAQDKWELSFECRKWGMAFANTLLAGLDVKSEEEAARLRADLGLFFDGLITFDIDLPGTPLRKAMDARERLLARIRASVQGQLDEIVAEKEPAVPGVKPRKNMLGYIIDANRANGEEVNVEFMAGLALGVLQAGTDTSSAGFNGLMVMMGQMPEVMARVREEQRAVVAEHGPSITKASLDASKYLDAVVREALRINSPGLAQMRTALADLELCGLRVPQGANIFLNVMTAHALELTPDYLQRYGPQVAAGGPVPVPSHLDLQAVRSAFKPERWMEPDPAKRPSLMTFGHGPHTCIGIALYMMEAKAMVAAIARSYDLQLLTEKVEWQEFPTIRPKHDTFLRLVPLAAADRV